MVFDPTPPVPQPAVQEKSNAVNCGRGSTCANAAPAAQSVSAITVVHVGSRRLMRAQTNLRSGFIWGFLLRFLRGAERPCKGHLKRQKRLLYTRLRVCQYP